MVSICTKEEVQEILSEKIAKLTVNVKDGEPCNNNNNSNNNNEPADPMVDSETCTTPTGKEYRIPEPLTCPPAPRAIRKRKETFSLDKYNNDPEKIVDPKDFDI